MKAAVLLFLLGPLCAFSQKQQADTLFQITGKIAGVPDHSAVTLNDLNNPTDTLARAEVEKGVFVLKGSVPEANLYQLNLDGPKKKLVLFLGNEQVSLKGDAADISHVQVSGSAVHKDFETFQDTFNPLFRRLGELNQALGGRQDLQEGDSLVLVYRAHMDSIEKAIDGFIEAHPASPVSPFLLVVTSQLEQDPMVSRHRLDKLSPACRDGFYGKILSEQLATALINAVGTEALDFTQADTSGKPVSLSSFRGKYVLVDFWASWCRPCRMENPNVVAAYNKFKSKNFTVLGVSLDRSREPWLKAIQDDQLAWTQVSDLQYWNNAVARKYNIESIPQNYLIGPDGKVIGKNLRGEALEAKLCELLGCD